jgi:uncharacterized protein
MYPKGALPGSRRFLRFVWSDAVYRMSTVAASPGSAQAALEAGTAEIVRLRALLEEYLSRDRPFAESFVPVPCAPGAPAVARSMAEAAEAVGVGPMAAVAGAFAEEVVRAIVAAGAAEAIVDNGGDVFVQAARDVFVGLLPAGPTGRPGPLESLALRLKAAMLPCAVCSSSAAMGHSLSFGRADLATVVAGSGALADACATALCNAVTTLEGASGAVEFYAAVPGVTGALAVIGGRLIAAGSGIDLVRHADPDVRGKVAAHRESEFPRRFGRP